MLPYIVEDIIKISAAFAAGALMGFEREYRSKPAGLRTLIMITVGSCLFTVLSQFFEANPDRIASNIVTGIGFIGAGVIFKDGFTVKGITTAATIWVAAAIGMCIGIGFYLLALFTLLMVLATLVILSRLEERLDKIHIVREYEISFDSKIYSLSELEKYFNTNGIVYLRYRFVRNQSIITAYYKIEATQQKSDELMQFLMSTSAITKFQT